MKIKTKSGLELVLDKKRFMNYELLDAIAEFEENPLVMPKVVTLLLGTEQKAKLMDHLRDEDGLVPIEKVEVELKEIFQACEDLKN